MNMTVTKDMQLSRCTQNRNAWLELLSHRHPGDIMEEEAATIPHKRSKTDRVAAATGADTNADSDSGIDTSSSRSTPEHDAQPAHTFGTIQEALQWASQGRDSRVPPLGIPSGIPLVPFGLADAKHVQVLCTGSLHLVGGILGLLDPKLKDSTA